MNSEPNGSTPDARLLSYVLTRICWSALHHKTVDFQRLIYRAPTIPDLASVPPIVRSVLPYRASKPIIVSR